MNCIKSSIAVIAAAILSVAVISCSKEPVKDYSLTASIASQGNDGINVEFTAGADISYIKYTVGSIFNYAQDSVAFARNTIAGQVNVKANAKTFKVTSEECAPVIIYLRGVKDNGEYGEVKCLQAVASPIAYKFSKVSLGSFVFTVPEDCGEYAGVGMMAMSADTPDDWMMSAEEIIGMYADYGMLDCIEPGASKIVELNGEPEIDHILGIVFWNEDYSYEIKTLNFTTGKVIAGAPAANVEISVNNVTADSADLVIDPDQNTYGYFYKLYKKADFEEDKAKGVGLGKNGIEYVRELCAAGGSFDFQTKIETREGLNSKTEYVFVCFPYNVNGSQGWGESKIVEFKTAE